MEEQPNDPRRAYDVRPTWLWRWSVGVIALWFVARALETGIGRLHDLLITLLVSLLVSCALEPSVNALAKRGWRRGLATATLLFGTITVICGAIVASGAVVVGQAGQLIDSVPELIDAVAKFARSFGITVQTESLSEQLTTRIQDLVTHSAGDVLVRTLGIVGRFAAGAFIVFYLVADGPRLRRAVCSALPARRQELVLEVWTTAIVKAGGYLSVRAVLAALSFVFSWVAFAIMGVPYAAALAVWVALVSQLVPVIGAYIGAALPIIVAATDNPSSGIWVLVFIIVYQQIENMVFSPKLNRELMSIHPAIGLIAVLGGAALAGAAGALIALPVVATVQAVVSASMEKHALVESELFNTNHVRREVSRRQVLRDKLQTNINVVGRNNTDVSSKERPNRTPSASTQKRVAKKPVVKKPVVEKPVVEKPVVKKASKKNTVAARNLDNLSPATKRALKKAPSKADQRKNSNDK